MCTVSDKLKLCTCDAADNLKHYWVLYRIVEGKEEMRIGEQVLPAFIEPEKNKLNNKLLLKLLNDGNAFDEPLYPLDLDRLQLSFSLENGSSIEYGFVYKKNKWKSLAYDSFEWYTKHDEIKQGKIKNALKI